MTKSKNSPSKLVLEWRKEVRQIVEVVSEMGGGIVHLNCGPGPSDDEYRMVLHFLFLDKFEMTMFTIIPPRELGFRDMKAWEAGDRQSVIRKIIYGMEDAIEKANEMYEYRYQSKFEGWG